MTPACAAARPVCGGAAATTACCGGRERGARRALLSAPRQVATGHSHCVNDSWPADVTCARLNLTGAVRALCPPAAHDVLKVAPEAAVVGPRRGPLLLIHLCRAAGRDDGAQRDGGFTCGRSGPKPAGLLYAPKRVHRHSLCARMCALSPIVVQPWASSDQCIPRNPTSAATNAPSITTTTNGPGALRCWARGCAVVKMPCDRAALRQWQLWREAHGAASRAPNHGQTLSSRQSLRVAPLLATPFEAHPMQPALRPAAPRRPVDALCLTPTCRAPPGSRAWA